MSDEIARLAVRIEANASRFDAQLRTANQSLERTRRQFETQAASIDRAFGRMGQNAATALRSIAPGLVAAASIEGLRQLARGALDTADRIDKLAVSADLGRERVQTLGFALAQSGVSAERGEAAITTFARRLGEFRASGAGPAAEGLRRLGLETSILNGTLPSTESALDAVLRSLSQMEDRSQQAAIAARLFGERVGSDMVRALASGADGLRDLEDRARDLGLVLEEELITKAVQIRDEWDAMVDAMSARFDRFVLQIQAGALDFRRAITNMMSMDALSAYRETFGDRDMPAPVSIPPAPVTADRPASRGRAAETERDPFADEIARLYRRDLDATVDHRVVMKEERQEAERLRIVLESLNRLYLQGVELAPEQVDEIEMFAKMIAATEQATRDLEQAQRDAARATEDQARAMQGLQDRMIGTIANARSLKDALGQIGRLLLETGLQGLFGRGPFGAAFGGGLPALFENAKGNAFSAGRVVPFARGGVVGGPTTFPMPGNRIGLMGEAGPEAIMPLRRGPGGRLGVEAHGGGTMRVIIEPSPLFDVHAADVAQGVSVKVVQASQRGPGFEAAVAKARRNNANSRVR